jgi:hypothetical protein
MKIVCVSVCLFWVMAVSGQSQWYEPFDYSSGSSLAGQGGWVAKTDPVPFCTLRQKLTYFTDTVMVCAHRALHITESNGSYAAENSLAAINLAIANHVDLFECDVRKSSDGVLVLMHDATVSRTTNGSGSVSALTYAQLKNLRLKYYNSSALTSECVPTLQQALTAAKGKIFVVLDIDEKTEASDVLPLVQQMEMTDNVMFFTKSMTDIQYLLNAGAIPMPSCYSNATFNSYQSSGIIPLVYQTDNGGYAQEWLLIKNAGIKLYDNVYLLTSTLPTADGWSQLTPDLQNGVNIVQTDYPIEMLAYLKSIHKH